MGLFDDLMGTFTELSDELTAPVKEVVDDVKGSIQDAAEIKNDVTDGVKQKVNDTGQNFVDGIKNSVKSDSDQ